MRNYKWEKVLTLVFCFFLFFSTMTAQADEPIQHSTVDYEASFYDATEIYICNEKEVDWEVGDKYFLHYTVTNVAANHTNQSGMLITKNPDLNFPYTEGGMHYGDNVSICEEGWTYLFRFEVTESGLKYIAGKAKGTDSSYIQFPYTVGEIKTKAPYFGIWITGTNGESLTAELKNMRCYDEEGNDLGIRASKAVQISISDMNPMNMKHNYSFSVEEAECLAFGSARYSKSDIIMLEYSVHNVKAEGITQSGVQLTNAPTAIYPHAADMGYLNFDFHSADSPTNLLTEGAKYLIRFERSKNNFEVLVRRTMPNGAVDYFSFANYYGTYHEKFGYAMIWIGEQCKVTANFTNVKCYDDKGNNLAIQTNKDVTITHSGGLEDYTQCVATYYCKENNTMISLSQECQAHIKTIGEINETRGVYTVDSGVLTIKIGKETNDFTYTYEYFEDVEGYRYIRLRDKQVTFMSQSVNGKVLATTTVGEATNYQIKKPEEPKDVNRNFVCWVDGSGKEYNFDTIVTESTTLYAKWNGEQEWEVMQSSLKNKMNMEVILSITVSIFLIGGTAVGILMLVRKRKKYEKKY